MKKYLFILLIVHYIIFSAYGQENIKELFEKPINIT